MRGMLALLALLPAWAAPALAQVTLKASHQFPGGKGEPGRITKVTPAPVAPTTATIAAGSPCATRSRARAGGSRTSVAP